MDDRAEDESNGQTGGGAPRSKLRVIVRRLLCKYGYSPDKQEKATKTVLKQAQMLCKEGAC